MVKDWQTLFIAAAASFTRLIATTHSFIWLMALLLVLLAAGILLPA
jgi:hypothetical protein